MRRGGSRRYSHPRRDGFVFMNGMGLENQGPHTPIDPGTFDLMGMEKRLSNTSKDIESIGRRMEYMDPRRSKSARGNTSTTQPIADSGVQQGVANVGSDIRLLNILTIETRMGDVTKDIKGLDSQLNATESELRKPEFEPAGTEVNTEDRLPPAIDTSSAGKEVSTVAREIRALEILGTESRMGDVTRDIKQLSRQVNNFQLELRIKTSRALIETAYQKASLPESEETSSLLPPTETDSELEAALEAALAQIRSRRAPKEVSAAEIRNSEPPFSTDSELEDALVALKIRRVQTEKTATKVRRVKIEEPVAGPVAPKRGWVSMPILGARHVPLNKLETASTQTITFESQSAQSESIEEETGTLPEETIEFKPVPIPNLDIFPEEWPLALETQKIQRSTSQTSSMQPELKKDSVALASAAVALEEEPSQDGEGLAIEKQEEEPSSPKKIEDIRPQKSKPDTARIKVRRLMGGLPSGSAELQLRTYKVNPAIHILGMSAVGKYIAHSLASVPHPRPIILLMHRPLMMQKFHDEGASIRIIRHNRVENRTGFHLESSAPFQRESRNQQFPGFGENLEHTAEPAKGTINTLIVATEETQTLAALTSIAHRIRPSTTICLIQDGMGLVDKINETLFPDPEQRPTYILGTVTHKFQATSEQFTIVETQRGCLACSKLPRGLSETSKAAGETEWSIITRSFMKTLATTPDFNTATVRPATFYTTQLEKLVIGSVLGPMSVIYDCTYDQLLYNYSTSRLLTSLLSELSSIILAMPELSKVPDLQKTFSVWRLYSIIVSVLKKNGRNYSEMFLDVKAGRRTKIDFFNGYFRRRAEELGVRNETNEMLINSVKGKQMIRSREQNGYIPFEKDY